MAKPKKTVWEDSIYTEIVLAIHVGINNNKALKQFLISNKAKHRYEHLTAAAITKRLNMLREKKIITEIKISHKRREFKINYGTLLNRFFDIFYEYNERHLPFIKTFNKYIKASNEDIGYQRTNRGVLKSIYLETKEGIKRLRDRKHILFKEFISDYFYHVFYLESLRRTSLDYLLKSIIVNFPTDNFSMSFEFLKEYNINIIDEKSGEFKKYYEHEKSDRKEFLELIDLIGINVQLLGKLPSSGILGFFSLDKILCKIGGKRYWKEKFFAIHRLSKQFPLK